MIKQFYISKIKPHLQKAVDEIKHPSNNPKMTAISMSIGVFIGIFIPIGLQTAAFIFLLAIVRYNFIIACTVSLISNPFTILPIYYFAIIIGEFLMSESFPWKYFNKFIDNPQWGYMLEFGYKGTLILFAGLTLMALIFTPLTYFLSFKLTSFLKKRKVLQ